MRAICWSLTQSDEFKSVPCDEDGFNRSGSSVGAWFIGKGDVDPGPGGGLGLGSEKSFRSSCSARFDGGSAGLSRSICDAGFVALVSRGM